MHKRLFVTTAITAVFFASSISVSAQSQRQIHKAQKPIKQQYIVVLAGPDDPDAVGLETEKLHNGRLKHVYRSALRGFAIQMQQADAVALLNDPRIKYIEEDGGVQISTTQSPATWGLDRIDQRALPLNNSYQYGPIGTGVTVHVIDTGIRPTHLEFAGRAVIAGDFVGDGRAGNDCNGHGTHVAGTIGGATYGVAKNVQLRAYRVLDCLGNGTNSGVIAGVDAVTANPMLPAVANMSLGGGPSQALDDAVRRSITAGVTFVVAAGNDNLNASFFSPARVAEAITVGATSSTDARAAFSNFGAVLDVFAPGVSIQSAWYTSNTATNTISGTSMASPHVAGVAATYLEGNPTKPPADVRNAIVAIATSGKVTNPGTGSPNLLLYSVFSGPPPPPPVTIPVVNVVRPNGGEKVYTGTPFTIRWTASDPEGIAQIDVQVSTDAGVTYSAVAGCTGLPGVQQTCTWAAPGPASTTARIKVVARDNAGDVGADASNANFSIITGTAFVTVTAPNTAANWARTSTQQIKWNHNLGTSSYVKIELSVDGGATFPTIIASSVKNSGTSSGVYNWVVPGPNVTNAVVRVTWIDGPVSDVSNVPFIIADPFLTLTAPTGTARWGYDSLQRQNWSTNLGAGDKIAITLSTDGGATFPHTLNAAAVASTKYANVRTPILGAATSTARIKVAWANAPSGTTLTAVNPANFTVEPAFVTVTVPNGGETWTAGTAATVKWSSNISSLESVRIELSTDGGATYPAVLLASTPSDGSQAVTPTSAQVTTSGRIRIVWLRTPTVQDASNANFVIH